VPTLSVALTGNVAAGKTTVAERWRARGAVIIDADQLVREVQAPGGPVLAAIVERFGAGMLRPDGTLDRAALRRIVFSDDAARAALNAIVHPAVQERRAALLAAAAAGGERIVVSDIPLLFEVLDPAEFDVVVLVDAPVAVRRERLVRGRGLLPDEVDRLFAAQLPSAGKRARSHIVIDNDGSLHALRAAADQAWDRLLDLAGTRA
jgi:dephospho-CoA kinase